MFSAQYQQSPVPHGAAMIKRHWPKRFTELPSLNGSRYVFQSWDTANKGGPDNDWSVCTTWLRADEYRWYLLDLWRGRVNYPELKLKVVELAKRWDPRQVLVEESGTAIGLVEELRWNVRGLTAIKPEKSKAAPNVHRLRQIRGRPGLLARTRILASRLGAGGVLIPGKPARRSNRFHQPSTSARRLWALGLGTTRGVKTLLTFPTLTSKVLPLR